MPSEEKTIRPFGYAGSAYRISPRPWAGANRSNVAAAVWASLLRASDQRPNTSWLTSIDSPWTSTLLHGVDGAFQVAARLVLGARRQRLARGVVLCGTLVLLQQHAQPVGCGRSGGKLSLDAVDQPSSVVVKSGRVASSQLAMSARSRRSRASSASACRACSSCASRSAGRSWMSGCSCRNTDARCCHALDRSLNDQHLIAPRAVDFDLLQNERLVFGGEYGRGGQWHWSAPLRWWSVSCDVRGTVASVRAAPVHLDDGMQMQNGFVAANRCIAQSRVQRKEQLVRLVSLPPARQEFRR